MKEDKRSFLYISRKTLCLKGFFSGRFLLDNHEVTALKAENNMVLFQFVIFT
jgi:hypothetical protein